MSEKKEQKTPAIEVVKELPHGMGYVLRLPVNANYCIIELKGLPDCINFPAESPRVYTICGVAASGFHAHKVGTESELMTVLTGRADVYLWNREGKNIRVSLFGLGCRAVDVDTSEILLSDEEGKFFHCLYVPSGVFHTVRYSPATVMQVVASVVYDRSYYEDADDYFSSDGLVKFNRTRPE